MKTVKPSKQFHSLVNRLIRASHAVGSFIAFEGSYIGNKDAERYFEETISKLKKLERAAKQALLDSIK